MKCKIELQRSDRILLWRDRRYVALGTYLNCAEFDKTDLVLEYSCQRLARYDAFIQKVWDNLDYTDKVRRAMGETKWKLQYGSACLTALNEQRTYAVGQICKAAMQKMDLEGTESLPTSTYGSEFVAAKLAVQQIINIQLMLRFTLEYRYSERLSYSVTTNWL